MGTDGKWSSQQHLPIEILENIIRHLDVPSLKSASLVCEYWRLVIGNNSKYLLFHGNTHTEKETIKVIKSDIRFVGHGLVITQILHPKNDIDYDDKIRVFDDGKDQTWDAKSSVEGKRTLVFISAIATEKIVVIENNIIGENQEKIKSSYGIWSRSGDYISNVEVENIGFKLYKFSLLFLLPRHQLAYLEVQDNKTIDLQHIKNNSKNDKLKIEKLLDFYHPFALVLSETGHILALKINNGLEMVGGVSRKKKSSKDLTDAKIAPHLIVMIEKFGEQKDWYACWELNIFDFDGNNLFRTSINEKWGSQHLDGFYHLRVDVRKGRRTVIYRIRNHLRILDLDSLREKYHQEGKVLFEIFPFNGSKRTRDWLDKNSRTIDMSDVNSKHNYSVNNASITFVESSHIRGREVDNELNRVTLSFSP